VAAGLAFPCAAQAIQITRRRKVKGKWSRETCYAITSLTLTQATYPQLAAIIRGHWDIEDRLHWVRDLDFDEDRSQVRTASGPRIMASLRNLVITILRLTGATSIAAALRYHARRPAAPPDDHAVLTGSAGPWVEGAVRRRFAEVATLPRVHPRWHQRRPWRDQR
jgi:predicted transposase YbfD/YdcC